MKTPLRTLFACCAASALAVSLSACGPDDGGSSLSNVAFTNGLQPGWSMMDLAGVDPAYYDDAALPDALPMQASYDGGYGYAPAYDYAPDYEGDDYRPLDDSYYYDDGYYDDGYYDDGYYQGGYDDGGYADDGFYSLGSDTSDYGLLALAVSLAGMLGNAPPDYGFDYNGVSPWAWETGDRYYRYAEPIEDGYRYYYYEPDASRPFFVSDPYYSYGYRDDRLVAIYDRDGRRVDARRAATQLRAAKAYYARAEQLHRASRQDRFGVPAPLWARHRDEFARDRDKWVKQQVKAPAWQQWEARNGTKLHREWSGEALVRRDAERRFASWQKADFRTPAPAFYTKQDRSEQEHQLAELRRDRAKDVAKRRDARAEQERKVRELAQRQAEKNRQAIAAKREERAAAPKGPQPKFERAAMRTPVRAAPDRRSELHQDRGQPERPAAQPPRQERQAALKAPPRREAKKAPERPKAVQKHQLPAPRPQAQAAKPDRSALLEQARHAAEQRRTEQAQKREAAQAAREATQQQSARDERQAAAQQQAERQAQARAARSEPRHKAPQTVARAERPHAAQRPSAPERKTAAQPAQQQQQRQEAREQARQTRQDARAEKREARQQRGNR